MLVRVVIAAALLMSSLTLADEVAAPDPRPAGNTLGIGVGWSFPQSILEPNAVSVRFRIGRLTLEPSARLGGSSSSTQSDGSVTVPGQAPTESKDRDTQGGFETNVGANVRVAVASRGPVDLLLIGGASVGYTTVTKNRNVTVPDQVDRETTTAFSAGLSWGIGLEWFLGHSVSLSADAQNPLFTVTHTNVHTDREQPLAGERVVTLNDSATSSVQGALTFRPTVRVMLHLYF